MLLRGRHKKASKTDRPLGATIVGHLLKGLPLPTVENMEEEFASSRWEDPAGELVREETASGRERLVRHHSIIIQFPRTRDHLPAPQGQWLRCVWVAEHRKTDRKGGVNVGNGPAKVEADRLVGRAGRPPQTMAMKHKPPPMYDLLGVGCI